MVLCSTGNVCCQPCADTIADPEGLPAWQDLGNKPQNVPGMTNKTGMLSVHHSVILNYSLMAWEYFM